MSGEAPMRCVLVPVEKYEHLLRCAVIAPKPLPTLSQKKRNKVREAMLDACVVNMQRSVAPPIPAVQEMMEKTLNNN